MYIIVDWREKFKKKMENGGDGGSRTRVLNKSDKTSFTRLGCLILELKHNQFKLRCAAYHLFFRETRNSSCHFG